jgi:hypothetical protein
MKFPHLSEEEIIELLKNKIHNENKLWLYFKHLSRIFKDYLRHFNQLVLGAILAY